MSLTSTEPTNKQLLSRIDLEASLPQVLNRVATEYKLGNITNYEFIRIGYQELNIKTFTSKGTFIVKIFSKDKPYDTIQEHLKGLVEFAKANIPVPQLLKSNNNLLYTTKGKKGKTYICVTKFFEGKNFLQMKPKREDIRNITYYLTKIHKLSFKINGYYDDWGTAHLDKEFKKRKKHLESEDVHLIEPIVKEFQKIDFSKFRKCIIHGDLQREHVLKNTQGEYCILDLGCMDFNASVIDLAIFIAVFCLDLDFPLKKNKEIYQFVVKEYLKRNRLNASGIDSLLIFIKATYAIYIVGANYELVVHKDKSKQTLNWLAWGKKGLNKFKNIQKF